MKQQPMYTSLLDLAEATLTDEGEVDCSFTLEFDPDDHDDMPNQARCYEATLSHGEITCITDKGTFIYMVDYYDGEPRLGELFDWELDGWLN